MASGETDCLGPRPLVICGPSGSGKTSILKKLMLEFPNTFKFSVSHTTRPARSFEEHGVHYYFVSEEEMQQKIADGEFIETAKFTDHTYGTSKMAVREIQKTGRVCVLDIEWQGVEQIKKTNLNPILVYNNPPSIEELERRLRKRGSESEESIKKRLASAVTEIEYGLKPGNFHKIIHNVVLDEAYEEFKEFVIGELKEQEKHGVTIIW